MISNQVQPERMRQSAGRRRTLDRAFRMLVVGTVAFAATLLGQQSAQATPFPDNSKQDRADNGAHSYCFNGSMTQARKDVVYWAMSRLDATTDMTVSSEVCNLKTDVWWSQRDLPGSVSGSYDCAYYAGAHKCDTAEIYLDFGEIDKGGDDWYDARQTAMHELGHSIGLGHHSPGAHQCAMYDGEVPGRDIKWRSYHSHDIGHINAAY